MMFISWVSYRSAFLMNSPSRFYDWSCSTLVGLAVAESIGLEQICKKSYMILPCSPTWRAGILECLSRFRLFLSLFLNAGAFPIAQQLVIVIFTANSPMGYMAVDYSSAPHVEPKTSETMVNEENEIRKRMKTIESDLQPSHEEHNPEDKSMCQEKVTGHETLDNGYLKYGCSHYRRRCRIRAPCCNEIFDCRHCHNEAKNSICIDQKLRHDLPRHLVDKVICSLCDTEQEVRQVCTNCGVCMGRYYCGICKLFDDETSKEQYHCDGCGICRIGGAKNFFHCDKCGCCYSAFLKNSHPCIERAMHQDCPVCFEYLFESRNDVIALACGHTIHKTCLDEMKEHYQYACPICSKSVCDMSKVWEKFDLEIAATPMPPYCDNKKVWILCNDCGSNSEVKYHVVAQKCPNCKSYNTRQTRGIGG